MTSPVLHEQREARRPANTFSGQTVNGTAKSQRTAAPWRIVVMARSVISSEGMAAILRRDSRFELCAAVHQEQGAEEIVDSYRPDLVLAEPLVQSVDGFRWIKIIAARFPDTRILVVSEHAESVFAERALRAGASGYFVKSGSADDLVRGIETIVSGEPRVNSWTSSHNEEQIGERGFGIKSELSSLSERELEVFSLFAAGHGVGRITEELGISRKTVETHCEHIKLKLGYRDARELKAGARHLLGS